MNEDISSKPCTNINALTTRSYQSLNNDAELDRMLSLTSTATDENTVPLSQSPLLHVCHNATKVKSKVVMMALQTERA